MVAYPLLATRKGNNNKQKIWIRDAGGDLLAYTVIKMAHIARRPTEVYADENGAQPLFTLTPRRERGKFFLDVTHVGGQALGSLMGGGFLMKDVSLLDPHGTPVGDVVTAGGKAAAAGFALRFMGGLLGALAASGLRKAQFSMNFRGQPTLNFEYRSAKEVLIHQLAPIDPADEALMAAVLPFFLALKIFAYA